MATKKTTSKKVAPKKAPVKPAAKAAPAKKAVAKAPVKAVAKAPVKPAAKAAPAKKAVAKASVKPAVKAAPAKKVVAKAPVKPAAKAAPAKKAVAKVPVKPAAKAVPAKKAVAKAPVKPATKVPAPVKKAVAKAPVKPAAKAAPAKKASVKTVPAKVESKGAAAKKVAEKPIEKTAPIKKAERSSKSSKPTLTKTITVTVGANAVKKSDEFKTSTFGTSNLKNDSGKVIAHRKTSELKRQNPDYAKVKKAEVEYTRSLLDMSPQESKVSYRYSDEELQEFKEIIERKLDTAKAELQYLQGVIMRKDESGTEDTENKYQNMEDGSASMDREQFNQLASRQITFITHLEQALVRIENKTYGICRETGKLIDKARLRAVPHATLSIEAKNAKK